MLLFDDHTYDDEKIINIHKEVERRYGIRGHTNDIPLTTELLLMKVEPLNPNVDLFSTVKNPVSPSVFDRLVDNKMNSTHHRSTKHLYQVNDHYDDPRSSTSFRNDPRESHGARPRKPKRPQSMRKHTRAMSDYMGKPTGHKIRAEELGYLDHGGYDS
jgi:hypothetical protein